MDFEPIRDKRIEAGVSQAAIAQVADKSLNWVYRLERRLLTPSRPDAEKVATLLGEPVDSLFSRVREVA